MLVCCVHVLDLLIEDIAKLPQIKAISEDVHFAIVFVKRFGLLYEAFLEVQLKAGIKCALAVFPLTRFACVYLMCEMS